MCAGSKLILEVKQRDKDFKEQKVMEECFKKYGGKSDD